LTDGRPTSRRTHARFESHRRPAAPIRGLAAVASPDRFTSSLELDFVQFFLFMLLNAVLFIRPAEIVPALLGWPIYNIVMLGCVAASFMSILQQFGVEALRQRPTTVCVLGVWAMVVLSNLAHQDLYWARENGVEFGKVVLYYLVLLAVVNTRERLMRFLPWLAIFATVLATLSLLHYHRIIRIPALEALERLDFANNVDEGTVFLQLQSTGVYNDPNDFCLILVTGVVISLWRLSDRQSGLTRLLWLAPLGSLFYAIVLTRSRGGFLALLVGLMTFFITRFGWRKAIPLGVVAFPLLLLMTGGRQTELSTGADTAQQRLQLWNDGFHRIAQSPITGIGAGRFLEEMGLVAHNSFVHAYTELGVFGGTCFLGVFVLPFWSLYRVGTQAGQITDSQLTRLQPFLISIVAAYATGLFSISRNYIVPTYTVVGIGASYISLCGAEALYVPLRFDGRLVVRLGVVSVCSMVVMYLFVRVFVRY
jgi:putative inorganic carbon (hco3(-)) transporter